MLPISSLLINFALFWLVGKFWISRSKKASNILTKVIEYLLFFSLIWLVGTAVGYLFTPLFFDHGEATVATIGANWIKGLPIYTEMDAPYRYSLLYGPWAMMVAGWMQGLGGNNLMMAKLPGVLNLLLMLFTFFSVLGSLNLSKFHRWLVLSVFAVSLLGMYQYSYWNRPDSFIALYLMLALFAVVNFGKSFKEQCLVHLAVGCLIGLSVNSKIHSIIYFVPVVFYYFEVRKLKTSFIGLGLGLFGGVFAFAFPYLFPGVSFFQFIDWLKMPLSQGLELDWALKNITYLAPFFIVLIVLGCHKIQPKTFISLIVSSLIVAVVSSKPGSGIQMFIPLFPLYFWLMATAYTKLDQPLPQMRLVLGALLFTLIYNASSRQQQVVYFFAQTASRWAEFNDLKNIALKNAGPVELGFAGVEQYESTFYKSWLVMNDKGLLLEGAALMETEFTKIPFPQKVTLNLQNCMTPTIVIPNGDTPWSILSFYDKRPLFSEEFRSIFTEKYKLVETTKYFRVYRCGSF